MNHEGPYAFLFSWFQCDISISARWFGIIFCSDIDDPQWSSLDQSYWLWSQVCRRLLAFIWILLIDPLKRRQDVWGEMTCSRRPWAGTRTRPATARSLCTWDAHSTIWAKQMALRHVFFHWRGIQEGTSFAIFEPLNMLHAKHVLTLLPTAFSKNLI